MRMIVAFSASRNMCRSAGTRCSSRRNSRNRLMIPSSSASNRLCLVSTHEMFPRRLRYPQRVGVPPPSGIDQGDGELLEARLPKAPEDGQALPGGQQVGPHPPDVGDMGQPRDPNRHGRRPFTERPPKEHPVGRHGVQVYYIRGALRRSTAKVTHKQPPAWTNAAAVGAAELKKFDNAATASAIGLQHSFGLALLFRQRS